MNLSSNLDGFRKEPLGLKFLVGERLLANIVFLETSGTSSSRTGDDSDEKPWWSFPPASSCVSSGWTAGSGSIKGARFTSWMFLEYWIPFLLITVIFGPSIAITRYLSAGKVGSILLVLFWASKTQSPVTRSVSLACRALSAYNLLFNFVSASFSRISARSSCLDDHKDGKVPRNFHPTSSSNGVTFSRECGTIVLWCWTYFWIAFLQLVYRSWTLRLLLLCPGSGVRLNRWTEGSVGQTYEPELPFLPTSRQS